MQNDSDTTSAAKGDYPQATEQIITTIYPNLVIEGKTPPSKPVLQTTDISYPMVDE